jgi:ABC-type branched-subunit amino acid transport system ATPase component/ABC-type branched-subunit amino acid transport system permease subunit
MRETWTPVLVAALAALAMPFVLRGLGLTLTNATDLAIYSIAVLGLNILVGHTGLVSFGHGAWFGLGAYGTALIQRHWLPGEFTLPLVAGVAIVALASLPAGALNLRRRGVYFSLLTLALTALLFAIAFRWTSFTGGESGLGGVVRPVVLGVDLGNPWIYYALVAAIGLVVVYGLRRFHLSPVGTVLVAIRENQQRATFQGYAPNRYKLFAFAVSATVTGLAGALSVFNHRFASAEPISVAFSGELLAMVVIGGMRSFLGPAIGAFFFILFREALSIWTPNWLFYFGLLFVGFIVFSPTGLVGVAERLLAPLRKKTVLAAAMAERKAAADSALPDFLKPPQHADGPILAVERVAKSFGGIRAVRGASLAVADRTLHALIGPNGAGKTTMFNLVSGLYAPDSGTVRLAGHDIAGRSADAINVRGLARSFQITNLYPALTVEENLRLGLQARHARRFDAWSRARSIAEIEQQTRDLIRYLGLEGLERADAASLSYGGQRLVDLGAALASRPRLLLLDEPLAGLAPAERLRVAALVKSISRDIPVLLVEHDIDRVFELADRVTVMNDGEILVDGTVEEARSDRRVQEVYIGSGAAALSAVPAQSAARGDLVLELAGVDTYYGKSHILSDVGLKVHAGEIVALLGRNGAGKSTLLKSIIGIAPPAAGAISLEGRDIAGAPPATIARRGIGYVPQGRALFAGMSVAHNLELGRLRRQTGAGSGWSEEKVFSFFPRLKERLDTPADYLSGGEQQMVAVARALAGDVKVLLLDEPFEGLAPAITEDLFRAFDKLRQDVAIIIVEHNLDLVLALADRAYVLERGRVVHEGPARDLARDIDLRRRVLWL